MGSSNKINIRDVYTQHSYQFYPVLIVGAGAAGILAGCRLKQKGFDQFCIVERQSGLGGVWHANRYPGVACDVPAVLYSYSFAPNNTCGSTYPTGPEFVQYLSNVAGKHGIIETIRFNTELQEARWIEEVSEWELVLLHLVEGMGDLSVREREERRKAAGDDAVYIYRERVRARIVISCVGFLNEPNPWPKGIPKDDFTGSIVHSARWRHDIDFRGKDIVVVGSGSSSAQLVPKLLEEPFRVNSVTQIIRSAPWILHHQTSAKGAVQDRYLSFVSRCWDFQSYFIRFYLYIRSEWDWFSIFRTAHPERRAKLEIDSLRRMRGTLPPKFHDMLTPRYPMGCKRRIVDNGWLASMLHPKYTATTRPLLRLVENTVVLGPETSRPDEAEEESSIHADIVILTNGFEATRWMHPMKIIGRQGRSLREFWAQQGTDQAYMGTAVESFPNFFMATGPNGSSGHTSYLLNCESIVELILNVIKPILRGDADMAEVRHDAMLKWDRELHRAFPETTFHHCTSWYQDENGWNSIIYPYINGGDVGFLTTEIGM